MIKINGDLVHDDYKDDNNEGDEHNDNGEWSCWCNGDDNDVYPDHYLNDDQNGIL